MHLNTATLCVALLVVAPGASAQDASEPVELVTERAAYKQEIDIATDPIKKRFAATLESLKRTLGARGKVEAALAVQREQDSLGIPQRSLEARDDAASEPAELVTARAAYKREMDTATNPIKKRYAATLESMKRTLGARGKVEAALAVQREQDSLGIPQRSFLEAREDARLIVWNQNNGGKGDRGTREINVSLRSGEKEVWRKNGIRMSWDKAKPSKESIAIPSAGIDTIRIEVTGLVNGRGGLAEVQFMKMGGENLTAGCHVSASGFWENNGRFSPAALTDGSPDTLWLLPDGKTGWAEIHLKARK